MPERAPLVRNAADPRQVREGGKEARFNRDQARDDLTSVLETDFGRRLLRRILDKTGLNGDPFTTSSEIYYRVGQQSIGKWLQKEIIGASPQAWLLMQQEAAALEIVRIEPERSESSTGEE